MTQEPPSIEGAISADEIDALREEERRLREAGRAAIGFSPNLTEERPTRQSLGAALRQSGTGWYPLAALCTLALVQFGPAAVLNLEGPNLSQSLGISASALSTVNMVNFLAISIATLPAAALVRHKARRAVLVLAVGFAWSIFTLFTGFVINLWGLLCVLLVGGIAGGGVAALHAPLVMDLYAPDVRVRALSVYQLAQRLAFSIGPLVVGISTAFFHLSWRGVFVVVGVLCLLGTLAASRLRDPGFGRYDIARVRQVVRQTFAREHGESTGPAKSAEMELQLGFFETCRRVLLIPTVVQVLPVSLLVGAFIFPFQTYFQFFLAYRWGMDTTARASLLAVLPLFTIPGLLWFGRHGERVFRENPERLLQLLARIVLVASFCTIAAVAVPVFGLMVAFIGLAFAGFSVLAPGATVVILSLVRPHMRSNVAAFQGILAAGVGGAGTLLLLQTFQVRFGSAVALVVWATQGLSIALIVRRAAKTVNRDLDRLIDEVVEEEQLADLRSRGHRLPLLACRHVDFSYGPLQVLFDVNFTVDDGELVALLGTNGAGKSSLLRVISGLGLPSKGSVNFRGADVSYAAAERRIPLGIVTVLGGRAVFRSMTVVDNLRIFGHMYGRDARRIEQGIEAAFDAFPVLMGRRDQTASTLSGGEQQMLALSQAYIVEPRLLLIDELSLGLAPIIVRNLIEMVRRINSAGTAVVLVEQSVNIALSVADHAYFMEKGEIRFDGNAADLLQQSDLLRAVFLEGASRGLA
jgi:ABC-type branched-subunit amino acid transport system ATPase component/predicted MFS family arabinose efflux permease